MTIGEQGQSQILLSDILISTAGWEEFFFKNLLKCIYFQSPCPEIMIPQVWGE